MRQLLIKQLIEDMYVEEKLEKQIQSEEDEQMHRQLREQVEFYLSPVNLCSDDYLMSLIKKNRLLKGWININKFLKFARIKQIFHRFNQQKKDVPQLIKILEKSIKNSSMIKYFQHKVKPRSFKFERDTKKILYFEGDNLSRSSLEQILSNEGFSNETYQIKSGTSWQFVFFKKSKIKHIEQIRTSLLKQITCFSHFRILSLEEFNSYKPQFNKIYQSLCHEIQEKKKNC